MDDVNETSCLSAAAGHDSVLHHNPPDAQQTNLRADGADHLLRAASQVPGAAEPSRVLEPRLLPWLASP